MRLPRSRRALELAIRATGVLAVLVIALVTGTLVEAWQQIVLVVILAVTATLPQSPAWLRYVTVLAEAGVIGAIVVSAPAGVRPSVAYLVVPPIVAALMAGVLGALAAGLTTTLVLVIGVVWRQGDNLPEPVADLMIWLAVAVALGLGTAVARHLRERIAPTQDSYAAARTLLSALREVTRRLPRDWKSPSSRAPPCPRSPRSFPTTMPRSIYKPARGTSSRRSTMTVLCPGRPTGIEACGLRSSKQERRCSARVDSTGPSGSPTAGAIRPVP